MVDPEAIARAAAIEVMHVDFADGLAKEDMTPERAARLSRGVGGVWFGHTSKEPETLMVNTRRSEQTQRLSAAHELGHAAYWRAWTENGREPLQELRPQYQSGIEAVCENLAAEILIPADRLIAEILPWRFIYERDLASTFGVPVRLMRKRLKGLGLL
jgi:Zn-dependent peptidase ImmA (M78 family)